MSDKVVNVMIGGYLIKESALLDYQGVLDCKAEYNGVVCITRDLEGKMDILMTDHLKKTGAKGLGAAGFVIGLAAPPLLLTTVVGAALGAGVGKAAERKVKSQIEKSAEQTIPWGGAGLIVAYPPESAEAIDKAVTHALKKITGEGEGKRAKALQAALADAQKNAASPSTPPAKK
jgi:uncharacterized membrane protein